jgi:FkbM family methyltransferase
MITISKYDQTFNFIEDSDTIGEIFNDNYKVIENKVHFEPNDVVIDIGANIGAFSILLAILYPFIKVIAIEPVAETYIKLYQNIKLNNLKNITPINTAISNSNRRIQHIVYSPIGTGGASSYVTQGCENHNEIHISCLTLDEIFEHCHIDKCKLLKIDCEGAEYDILYGSTKLRQIEYLVGEFHENTLLRNSGHTPEKLAKYCADRVKYMMYYEYCIMYE